MDKSQFNTLLQAIATLSARVEVVYGEVHAIQEAQKQFITKQEAKRFATKNDLKGFATKDDLRKFATKDDFKKFATKDDLKRFITKDDLRQFVTKKDLKKLLSDTVKEILNSFSKPFADLEQRVIRNHEERLKQIEGTLNPSLK